MLHALCRIAAIGGTKFESKKLRTCSTECATHLDQSHWHKIFSNHQVLLAPEEAKKSCADCEHSDWTSYCSHLKCVSREYHVGLHIHQVTTVYHSKFEQYGQKHICMQGLHKQGACGCECYDEDLSEMSPVLHNWMVGIKTAFNVNSNIVLKGIDTRLTDLAVFREALMETMISTLEAKRDALNITSIVKHSKPHYEVLKEHNVCQDSCSAFSHNGECDDGGEGSDYSNCPLGTDCSDCGHREELMTGLINKLPLQQTHAKFDRLNYNSLDSVKVSYSVVVVGKDAATEMQDQIESVAALPQAFLLDLRSNIATLAAAADSRPADQLKIASNHFRIILNSASSVIYDKSEPCFGWSRKGDCSGHGQPSVGRWSVALGDFDTSTCSCRCDPGFTGASCSECAGFACCNDCVDLTATYWTGDACGSAQRRMDKAVLGRFYRRWDPTKLDDMDDILDAFNWTSINAHLEQRYGADAGPRQEVGVQPEYQPASAIAAGADAAGQSMAYKAATVCCSMDGGACHSKGWIKSASVTVIASGQSPSSFSSSSSSSSSSHLSQHFACFPRNATFLQAQRACAAASMRLCTRRELLSELCCADASDACAANERRVWSISKEFAPANHSWMEKYEGLVPSRWSRLNSSWGEKRPGYVPTRHERVDAGAGVDTGAGADAGTDIGEVAP